MSKSGRRSTASTYRCGPPADVENDIFFRLSSGGLSEVSITLLATFAEFEDDVRARIEHDPPRDLATSRHGYAILVLLPCKHFGTPVFPQFWRGQMFEDEEPSEGAVTAAEAS